jgi:hypothetical protein
MEEASINLITLLFSTWRSDLAESILPMAGLTMFMFMLELALLKKF